jgi:3-methyladenine DNA glycosylase AlkD
MPVELAAIKEKLKSKSDPSAIEFASRVVPGARKIYGVKTPELNLIAREFKAGGFELVKKLWQSGALEEKIIAIKILEKIGSKDPEQTLDLVKRFSLQIENWAECDGLGMQALKAVRKNRTKEIFALAEKYNRSKNLWQRRLSLVMVEWFTRDPLYHPRIKKLVKHLEEDEEYYVRKAVQWINRNFKKGK